MIRTALLALVLGAAPALAEDVALVVGNASYDNGRSIRAADEILEAAEALEAAGFRVFSGEDMAAADLRALAQRFAAAADGSGRIVVALSGHFAQSGAGTWFLATDARRTDPVTAGAEGLPLGVLLDIAARAPGRSVVLLGTEDRDIALGAGLTRGIGAPEVPQGVALLWGEANAVADFASGALVEPGLGLASAVADAGDLTADGFVTDLAPLVVAGDAPPSPPVIVPEAGNPRGERAAWALALAEDTIASYEDYLRLYPASANAPLARAAIARLRAATDPAAAAQAAEDGLRLTRDQRRQVQRSLSLLGYDPRGIDGIFGRGTRSALEGWQRANRFEPTGYLTEDQIARLDAQAARRAEELEAEAAARQAEQDRADRLYWNETGARGDEAGLRAYLRRYPDGLYAEVAQDRLRPFDEAAQAEAAAADRAAWELATDADTVAAYRDYLASQPRGAFRDRAEARIETLTRQGDASAAARAEEALGLTPFTRNLIESRLDALGLGPGRVDGTFDADTRRAIRRFQSTRNLPASGYMSQATVVRLLADSILR
jgi:peptidoglycan hydrolase-like protein with peptidoglycan-binding domain